MGVRGKEGRKEKHVSYITSDVWLKIYKDVNQIPRDHSNYADKMH